MAELPLAELLGPSLIMKTSRAVPARAIRLHPKTNLQKTTLAVIANLAVTISCVVACSTPTWSQTTMFPYVITNDDPAGPNTVSFYAVSGTPSAPQLTLQRVVQTGGVGMGVSYFAGTGLTAVHDSRYDCLYVADGGSADVAGIDLHTFEVTGRFKGSSMDDDGGGVGIALAIGDGYVYASFTGTYNIATFRVMSGCRLHFVADIGALGKGFGAVGPMAVRGNLLAVAYGDSTIESFDISNGVPVRNGDQQLSTGSRTGDRPSGVAITEDGHYVIFGDISWTTTVEVSEVVEGKLSPTIVYHLGLAADSTTVQLSPDDNLLYIANTTNGTVTAAFFDKNTGVPSRGCVSRQLSGFGRNWLLLGNIRAATSSGTGQALYVAEDEPQSSIAILRVWTTNGTCRLTELPGSPIADPNSPLLRELATLP